jgi:uncharacterized protein involved in exopolysaccharide biosynthesis
MEVNSNDEIDIIDLLKKLYKSRKLIILITIIFSTIGVALALLSPIKYSSTTIFITQNQETPSTSLSGVASLVGINLGGSSFGGDIPPSMYPKIIESVKFKRLLLDKVIDKEKNLTLENFIVEHYSIEKDLEQNVSDLGMTLSEEAFFIILTGLVNVSVNQKDGFISINCEMPNAEYSAKIAKFSRELLQNIIIENKIETARQNLIFSESQLIEKKKEFDEIYSKLAYFSDSNLNSVNSFVLNEKNKLESEFQIISAVVEEISKQVEQAKLQLKKDTPVFSTIQEAIIPIKKSSPKRAQIVIIFGFVGIIFSCISILISNPLKNIFSEIKNNKDF